MQAAKPARQQSAPLGFGWASLLIVGVLWLVYRGWRVRRAENKRPRELTLAERDRVNRGMILRRSRVWKN